jgi:predicted aldo/keto reductase-like oxidoreductase
MPFRSTKAATSRFVPGLGSVCRLGLATRGNTTLDAEDVLMAVGRGVNYLNWCGHPDGMCEAIGRLGSRRSEVCVAIQFSARTSEEARNELDQALRALKTDYIDVATYYYVEHDEEWDTIVSPGGAAQVLEQARSKGTVRAIGLTSHQRRLASRCAETGRLDLLMIRYNAAHRGAEQDVFPVTRRLDLPVVAFTCLRWRTLLQETPEDPPGFSVPPAEDWYRWVLHSPHVAVALMAPDGQQELLRNLEILDDARSMPEQSRRLLTEHGDRVRHHSRPFP